MPSSSIRADAGLARRTPDNGGPIDAEVVLPGDGGNGDDGRTYIRLLMDLLIKDFPESVYIKDRASCFVFGNETIARTHDLPSATALVGKTDHDLHHPDEADAFFAKEQEVMKTGVALLEHRERNGSRWFSTTKIPIRDRNGTGDVIGLVGIGRDITVQKAAEELLAEQSRIIEMIALNAPIGRILERLVAIVELRLPGLSGSIAIEGGASAMPGEGVAGGRHPGDEGPAPRPGWGDYGRVCLEGGPRANWAVAISNPRGTLLGTLSFSSEAERLPTPEEREIVASVHRIAGIALERNRTLARINHLAFNDPLTGLRNRASLAEELPRMVADAASASASFRVVLVDLDDFRLINDTFGHGVGDEVLTITARRILAVAGHARAVFRIGEDEFVVVETGPRQKRTADGTRPLTIEAAVSEPIETGGQSIRLTASIGVAVYPKHGRTADELLRNAAAALHRAKDLGSNRVQVFKAALGRAAEEKLTLNRDLQRALERDELSIAYQPQVQIGTGRLFAVEALLRWNHPILGPVSPAKFIPLAEETGAIVPIGHWILHQACSQCKAWQDQKLRPISVCVNVSPRQFRERDWASSVLRTLKDTGLDGRFLEVEITESCLMADVENAIASMNMLKAHGVSIAIDDFGTGYSNLGALKRFPVQRLKIDRSFIGDMLNQDSDRAITSAFISLGQKLGLRVIAEGVETSEQLEFLRLNHCDEMQGYLFSRPVPVAAIETMLRAA